MDLNVIKLNEDSLQAALKLRLKVELHIGKRVKRTSTIEDLLSLLKYSQKSLSEEITSAFEQFIQSLAPDQCSFFKTLGLDLNLEKSAGKKPIGSTYRGAHILNKKNEQQAPNAVSEIKDGVSDSEKQRKKKMYRGREVL